MTTAKYETFELASGHKVVAPQFPSTASAVSAYGEEAVLNILNLAIKNRFVTKAALKVKESKPTPPAGAMIIPQLEAERWVPGSKALGTKKQSQQLLVDFQAGKISQDDFIVKAKELAAKLAAEQAEAEAEKKAA